MTNVLISLTAAYAAQAKARFARKTLQVEAVQERFLQELLQAHQATELGNQWQLKTIKTVDQFRDRIPVLPYSSYEPYTDRIAQGETNVLTADRVTYINLTSGSTGKKKQVPVTPQFQRTLRRADVAAMGFMFEGLQRRRLKLGKSLLTNSVILQGRTSGGIEYGPVSVGSLRQGRMLFEKFLTPPYSALQIADTLARHYVCLLFALRDPHMRGITANFPMLLLRTCCYLEHYAEPLLEDLQHGTIAPWLSLEPQLRSQLERQWAPAPKRAAELRAIWQAAGKLTPQLAWAELSYTVTARGGTSNFYFERFAEYLGNTPSFGGVYGSAEATLGIYPDFDQDGSILAIESGFYEFVPPDQWQAEHPQTLLPCEVKMGERYRILLTSYSGFYRYDIGDVVEVVGFFEQAPLIVFRHRQGGLLSSTTEKTTEFHATQTLQALQQEFNVRLEDFCITLSKTECPARYVLNVELAFGQTLDRPTQFLERFEHWMGEFNNLYRIARQGQVPPSTLRILAPGSFARVRQRQVDRGMFDSQLKFPHISEDRSFLADFGVLQEVVGAMNISVI
ncbi:MAG: GH3 auxin-responsive promoter family protein [Leptolyngbyaceae cyanobacterium CSU_1_4]|nr:GH3 auxin-responsive promoter family protein [Leptolyngbyaceae cyanobacterium CSU_1_4]